MNRYTFWFFPGLFLFAILASPTARAESNQLSLNEYLTILKNTHPLMQEQDLAVSIAEENQRGFRGAEDWQHKAEAQYSYTEPVNTGIDVPEDMHGPNVGTSLSRSVWDTGARVSVSWDYYNRDINPQLIGVTQDILVPGGPSDIFSNGLFLEVSQPLLRNWNGVLDRLDYDLAGQEIKIAKMQTAEKKEAFLLLETRQYLQWATAVERKRIAEARLGIAKRQYNQMKEKYDAKVGRKVDVTRALNSIKQAQQSLSFADSEAQGAQQHLAATAEDWSILEKKPAFNLYQRRNVPAADFLTIESRKSRLIQAIQFAKDKNDVAHRGFEEMEEADVQLMLRTGLRSDNDSFDDALSPDQPDLTGGIVYSIPLGNRTAKSNLLKTELENRRLNKEQVKIERELQAAIKRLVKQLSEMKRVLQYGDQLIASSKNKTADEQKLYDRGQNDLSFVIQSQDAEQLFKASHANKAQLYQMLWYELEAVRDRIYPEE